jgi:hypothetical protein
MSEYSDAYNKLPYETRVIAGAVIMQTQINQIKNDQRKAKNAYQKFMRETNEQLSNLEIALRKTSSGKALSHQQPNKEETQE